MYVLCQQTDNLVNVSVDSMHGCKRYRFAVELPAYIEKWNENDGMHLSVFTNMPPHNTHSIWFDDVHEPFGLVFLWLRTTRAIWIEIFFLLTLNDLCYLNFENFVGFILILNEIDFFSIFFFFSPKLAVVSVDEEVFWPYSVHSRQQS